MILTGRKIAEEVEKDNINIEPFDKEKVTTNSYDLELGAKYIRYTEDIIDPARKNSFEEKEIPKDGMRMSKGDFILGYSNEIVGSDRFVPIIHAKSSIARLGLFVHVTANLIDIGSTGQLTFQLYSTSELKLYPGMEIAQVTFWKPKGDITLYDGKYADSRGPNASKVYKDFE